MVCKFGGWIVVSAPRLPPSPAAKSYQYYCQYTGYKKIELNYESPFYTTGLIDSSGLVMVEWVLLNGKPWEAWPSMFICSKATCCIAAKVVVVRMRRKKL